jgi:hypothetical protein
MKKVITSLTSSLFLFLSCQVLQAQTNRFGDSPFETSSKVKDKDVDRDNNNGNGNGNGNQQTNRPTCRSMVALVFYWLPACFTDLKLQERGKLR